MTQGRDSATSSDGLDDDERLAMEAEVSGAGPLFLLCAALPLSLSLPFAKRFPRC